MPPLVRISGFSHKDTCVFIHFHKKLQFVFPCFPDFHKYQPFYNQLSLYHERRKGSAARAAFTFQAVAPGIIPAEQGEAGIRFGSHNVQSLYQKTELFGISNEILENTKSSALYFWEYKIWYKWLKIVQNCIHAHF